MKKLIFKTKQEVAEGFAKHLKDMVNTGQNVHVALSGGSTPKLIFDYMAEHFETEIQWSNLHLYWGDERCVAPTDSESNYKMTVDHLLSKIQIPKGNIHRILGENDPAEEAKRYGDLLSQNLSHSNGLPQFDLVILGMGDDGHTASVFPDHIELWHSDQLCEVATHPDSGQKRVSITGGIINNAKEVIFLVTGASKAQKLDEIIHQKEGYLKYPASLVAPTSGNLAWYLDHDAAEFIS